MVERSSANAALRAIAEARVRRARPRRAERLRDDRTLVHELQVHQIELEMQNEALRKSQAEQEMARDRYADLFNFAPVVYVTLSRDGRIVEANLAAASGFGVPQPELVDQCFERFVAPVDSERWRRHAAAGWQEPGKRMLEFELLLRKVDGAQFSAQFHCMAINRPGMPDTMRIALFDSTERSAAAAEMQRLAYHDALTQLPNRRLFEDRLVHAVAGSKRSGLHGSILFLDLDNFKPLNDIHGHDAGDRLLIEIARRLRSGLREGDTVARIGGDEFVMILEALDASEKGAEALARQVGEKLRRAVSQHFDLGGVTFQCTTSIGVRLFGPREQVDDLLRHADRALYQAKRAGRNQMRFFDPSL